MTPWETGESDRRLIDRWRTDRGRNARRLLRAGVTFALSFLAGLVLVKLSKRRDGDRSRDEGRTIRKAASRIRSRAIPAKLDPGQTAGPGGARTSGSGQSSFVNPTVRIASGDTAQSTGGRGSASQSNGGESKSGGTEPRPDGATSQMGRTESRTGGTKSRTETAETPGPDAEPSELSPPTVRGMPMLGVGTRQDADYDECLDSIRQALGMGYRHVDATERREAYYVEEAVGDAISEVAIDREELFVATKVDPDDLAHDHVLTSAEESLDRLDLDSLDLLYVHWPTGEYDPTETLGAFAELRQEGRIEEIGVSNFTAEQLEEAIGVCDEPIFANQVEMHPLLPQEDLRQFCSRDDVDVELVAYSPIARGDVEHVDQLWEVADKHGATPEQVSLAWLREKGVTAIPEASTDEHLRENWLSLGLDLDDEDVAKIDSIEERERIVDPDDAPWNR